LYSNQYQHITGEEKKYDMSYVRGIALTRVSIDPAKFFMERNTLNGYQFPYKAFLDWVFFKFTLTN